jgi:hypothetical protein
MGIGVVELCICFCIFLFIINICIPIINYHYTLGLLFKRFIKSLNNGIFLNRFFRYVR